MGERFLEFLRQLLQGGLWYLLSLFNGYVLFRLTVPFLSLRKKWWWRAILLLLFAGSSMVIWVGDPNLLYTLPVFLAVFFLCTRGERVGRLAMCLIVFCLVMSVCALLDTYLGDLDDYDVVTRLARPVVFGGLYLLLRRRLPAEPVTLSPRLWRLTLGLAAMPFCALTAVVLLTYTKYDSPAAYVQAMNLGLVVLPFVLLTSFMLRVENALGEAVAPDLATTKADKAAHGLGLPGMREITGRYGGTLETGVKAGRFELVACIPV